MITNNVICCLTTHIHVSNPGNGEPCKQGKGRDWSGKLIYTEMNTFIRWNILYPWWGVKALKAISWLLKQNPSNNTLRYPNLTPHSCKPDSVSNHPLNHCQTLNSSSKPKSLVKGVLCATRLWRIPSIKNTKLAVLLPNKASASKSITLVILNLYWVPQTPRLLSYNSTQFRLTMYPLVALIKIQRHNVNINKILPH